MMVADLTLLYLVYLYRMIRHPEFQIKETLTIDFKEPITHILTLTTVILSAYFTLYVLVLSENLKLACKKKDTLGKILLIFN